MNATYPTSPKPLDDLTGVPWRFFLTRVPLADGPGLLSAELSARYFPAGGLVPAIGAVMRGYAKRLGDDATYFFPRILLRRTAVDLPWQPVTLVPILELTGTSCGPFFPSGHFDGFLIPILCDADLTAFGALADYLDEIGDPRAGAVRAFYVNTSAEPTPDRWNYVAPHLCDLFTVHHAA